MRGDRWIRAGNALGALVDTVNKYLDNGVNLVFLNSNRQGQGLKVHLCSIHVKYSRAFLNLVVS